MASETSVSGAFLFAIRESGVGQKRPGSAGTLRVVAQARKGWLNVDRKSLDRFERKYIVAAESHPTLGTPCWLWTGNMQVQGYGCFGTHKERSRWKRAAAHKVLWEHVNGPVPEGLELDHLCRVRRCVRPDHLEAVTHTENVRRGEAGLHNPPPPTHCPKGHLFNGANTYTVKDPRGHHRRCKRCHADRAKMARAKKRTDLGTQG